MPPTPRVPDGELPDSGQFLPSTLAFANGRIIKGPQDSPHREREICRDRNNQRIRF